MKWWPVLVLGLGFAACATLERSDAPWTGTSEVPNWQIDRILEDTQFLAARRRFSRLTSYSDAANYISDRMEGIQPVAGPSRVVNLAAPLRMIHRATLMGAVALENEVDYAPYALSDSGQVHITSLVPLDAIEQIDVWDSTAALVTDKPLSIPQLHRLAARGVGAVLVVGIIEHRPPAQEAPDGLVALQITDTAAMQIAGHSPDDWSQWLVEGGKRMLASTLTIGVDVHAETWMPSVMGFVPGRDPTHSSEAVIVCAGLAEPVPEEEPLATFGGHAPVLVMELARQYSRWSALELFPKRTVLFAIWPESLHGYAGLSAYLANPVWPLDETHSIYCIGDEHTRSAPPTHETVTVNTVEVPAQVSQLERTMDALHHAVREAASGH